MASDVMAISVLNSDETVHVATCEHTHTLGGSPCLTIHEYTRIPHYNHAIIFIAVHSVCLEMELLYYIEACIEILHPRSIVLQIDVES